jgi:leukotriene-A4 hydrolase
MKLSELSLVLMLFAGCMEKKPGPEARDPHSCASPDGAVTEHLELSLAVSFEEKVLHGTATYKIKNPGGASHICFDTKGLEIESIESINGKPLRYSSGKEDKILGSPLKVEIGPDTRIVSFRYRTRPGSEALQWLSPGQTSGKKLPFMYTQSQAILARTWLPCQDSPGIRFTYKARICVPEGMIALMSAENPRSVNDSGVYVFHQTNPIPAYLMALAAGKIDFRPVGKKTGVYAEPEMIGKAAYEFSEMDAMLEAVEKLYGPYRWGRYDLLVLPPGFPFGGMENPCLTFATPTVIAGDRSLTSLVAHELAHSWSGNLVTNVTWDDFWLNEGFTVYFERRIMEEVYGRSYADMLAAIGFSELRATLSDLGEKHPDTRLKLDLKGRNPDDAVSDIAYEKGFALLKLLETSAGRQQFDSFLRKYFAENAFKSMSTEGFLRHLKQELVKDPERYRQLKIDEWVYQAGLPDNCPDLVSERLSRVESVAATITGGRLPRSAAWTSHEWLHFIRNLPADLTVGQMKELDSAFNFTGSGNSEVLGAWLLLSVKKNYREAFPALKSFLVNVGRRKFLTPIYRELIRTGEGRKLALEIYAKARPNYHSVATSTLDEILGLKPS